MANNNWDFANRLWHAIRLWDNAPTNGFDLYEIYEKPSVKKVQMLEHYERIADDDGAVAKGIVAHNKFYFTYAYLYRGYMFDGQLGQVETCFRLHVFTPYGETDVAYVHKATDEQIIQSARNRVLFAKNRISDVDNPLKM